MIYTSEILLPVIAQAESYFARLMNDNFSNLEKGKKPTNIDKIERLWLFKEALTYCNDLELYDSAYTTYIYKEVLKLISGHGVSLTISDGDISAPVLDYYLLGNAEPTPLASSSVYGKVRLSIPAANPSFPIALGANDPVLANHTSAYNDTILSAVLNSTGQVVLTQRDGGTITTPQAAILNQNSAVQNIQARINGLITYVIPQVHGSDYQAIKIEEFVEDAWFNRVVIGAENLSSSYGGYIDLYGENGTLAFRLHYQYGIQFFTDPDQYALDGYIIAWSESTKNIHPVSYDTFFTATYSILDLRYPLITDLDNYVLKAGDTMTGALLINSPSSKITKSTSGIAFEIADTSSGTALIINKLASGFALDVQTGTTNLQSLIVNSISQASTDTDRFLVSDSGTIKYRTGSQILSDIGAQAAGTYVTSVAGTSNRITSTGGTTPVIDIASTYVGQTSITTLGTITTGVWQGTAVANAYIGTGIDATKIADGSVSNTEFQYINSLTSNAQTQLDGKQPLSTNLTSLSGLTYVSTSFVKMTSSGTFVLDTNTYLTGNQSITLSGDVTGSGTTAITTTIGAGVVTNTMLAGSIASSKLVGTDITTVGTITSGIWQGSAIADSYISSASTWNAKIGGSGTTGKLSKFTGSSTLGDSVLTETSDGIAIFGTTPDIYSNFGSSDRLLTISVATSSAYAAFTLAGGAGGGGEIDFGNQTIRHAAIASLNGSILGFYTNRTNTGIGVSEAMRINSSGSININNGTDTGEWLIVNGDTRINSSLLTTGVAVFSSTLDSGLHTIISGAGSPLLLRKSSSFTGSFYIMFQNSSAIDIGYLGYGSGGNDKMQLYNGLDEVAISSGTSTLTVGFNGAGSSINTNFTATSFIKSGGISTEFLKADGSVDSNTYLTANQTITLSGQASGSGTTSISVTLDNSAVINKVLTGLSISGSTITATDSILTAFGKLQNQLNGLSGGLVYKGSWNANTNSPTLADGVGTTGWLYIVTVAGTQDLGSGNITFAIGDWVIYNGSIWEKVSNTNDVTSVNGYTGAVSLTTNDISENTNLYFTNARAIASTLTSYSSGAGTISSSDTILQAIQKLNGNFVAGNITIGSTVITINNSTSTLAGLSSVTSTSFVGALTGNASTATILQTSRTINGVSFNGSADITVTAAAGTLTGTTLNSSVITSSLTTVGTIAVGVWQGTAISDTYIASSSNWNTAYTQTRQWDGGSTGLNASTARTSLGLVIGTNVQAYDSDLQAISSGTLTGNGFLVRNSGTWSIDTNTYTNYTNTDARLAISESILGIDYNNSTGEFTLTSGYIIPTSDDETNWNLAYNELITNITFNTSTGDLILNQQDNGELIVNLDGRYLTSLSAITLSGDISGTGTTSIVTTIGAGKVTNAMLAGSIAASKLIGTDITTVGTISSGIWNGTAITDSYISSASTWNSKIGGSGTSSFLPKFSTGSTLSNSLLEESADTISLVKDAPYISFDLNNTAEFSNNFSLRSVADDGSSVGGSFQIYDVTNDVLRFQITPYGVGFDSTTDNYFNFEDGQLAIYSDSTLATLKSFWLYGTTIRINGTTEVKTDIGASTMLSTTSLGNTLAGATVLNGSGANSLKLTNTLTSSNGTYTILTRNSSTGIVENIFPTSLRRTAVNDVNHTMTTADELIAFSFLTAPRTVTLLPPGSFSGSSTRVRKVIIKDEWGTAQTSPIAITVSGGTKINGVNGSSTVYINTAFGAIELYTTGTYWYTTNVM